MSTAFVHLVIGIDLLFVIYDLCSHSYNVRLDTLGKQIHWATDDETDNFDISSLKRAVFEI